MSTKLDDELPTLDRPWGVPPNAICLMLNSYGDASLWVFQTNNKRCVQYGFQSVYPMSTGEEVSEPVYRKKSQLMAKDGYKFVLDMPGAFDGADIDRARYNFNKAIKIAPVIDGAECCAIQDVYLWLCNYAKGNPIKDIISVTSDKDDCQFANIETKTFDELVISEGWGWKPLEVKKRLKTLQLIRTNANRPYDWAMTNDDGKTYRTISFRMAVNLDA